MTRRSHKKSRAGCVECKRRHVKCDEGKPTCGGCRISGVACVYQFPQAAADSPSAAQSPRTPACASHPAFDFNSSHHGLPPSPHPPDPLALNFDHLELLHNFSTATVKTFTLYPTEQVVWQTEVVQLALRFPFLMHQLLAISAFHIASTDGARRPHFLNLGSELQSKGLRLFNTQQKDIDTSSCGAIFIFSCFIAIGMLADSSRTQGLDLVIENHAYVDYMISCLSLMQAIHRVGITTWWPTLQSTSIAPLLNPGQRPYSDSDVPAECRGLHLLVRESSASLTPRFGFAAVEACERAVERMCWTFAMAEAPQKNSTTMRWLISWPVQLSEPFFRLLHAREPVSLVIVAYYGALMHSYRDCWSVAETGRQWVKAVAGFVQGEHRKWLRWPLELVER